MVGVDIARHRRLKLRLGEGRDFSDKWEEAMVIGAMTSGRTMVVVSPPEKWNGSPWRWKRRDVWEGG